MCLVWTNKNWQCKNYSKNGPTRVSEVSWNHLRRKKDQLKYSRMFQGPKDLGRPDGRLHIFEGLLNKRCWRILSSSTKTDGEKSWETLGNFYVQSCYFMKWAVLWVSKPWSSGTFIQKAFLECSSACYILRIQRQMTSFFYTSENFAIYRVYIIRVKVRFDRCYRKKDVCGVLRKERRRPPLFLVGSRGEGAPQEWAMWALRVWHTGLSKGTKHREARWAQSCLRLRAGGSMRPGQPAEPLETLPVLCKKSK